MKTQDLSGKVHFQRWLDKNPPSHDKLYNAIRCYKNKKSWGAYLRWKDPASFNRLYTDFWLRRPDIWSQAYDSPNPNDTFP